MANANACFNYLKKNNIGYKRNKDKVYVEYSFNSIGKPHTKNNTLSNKYSGFRDWKKCKSPKLEEREVVRGRWRYDISDVYCNNNRKLFFKMTGSAYPFLKGYATKDFHRYAWYDHNGNLERARDYRKDFLWYDRKGNEWETGNIRTSIWESTSCQLMKGVFGKTFYTDFETTLYHQKNYDLDQYWAAIVTKKRFYEVINPKF
ncbi:MAG: hypothetical protein JJ848_009575 [Prochlorococcus marinus CUG1439]|nr:hypothetical protein [Prochlorococcus marinus CUG1439]